VDFTRSVKKCSAKSKRGVVWRGGIPMIKQSSGEAPRQHVVEHSETRPSFTIQWKT
jgi:hypothetical protein